VNHIYCVVIKVAESHFIFGVRKVGFSVVQIIMFLWDWFTGVLGYLGKCKVNHTHLLSFISP
jgi:hypothetical protein